MKLPGDGHRVQRPGAAGCHHREIPRVVALGDRYLPHRERHLVDRDPNDRIGDGGHLHAELPGEIVVDSPLCSVRVELHAATQERIGADPAEDDVGIGDRGQVAAVGVADRSRVGTGALRPHLERPHLVDPGDAAAARPYLDHVDDRQDHRVAARIAPDIVAFGMGWLAFADQRRLGRRTTHVEGDDVGEAERATYFGRCDYAADGARFHHRCRAVARRLGRHRAAVRLHDRDVAPVANPFEPGLQVLQIAAHPRADIGVHHRRRDAFVLPVGPQDLVRQRDEAIRQQAAQDPADFDLMARVGVGVQQADRDRLDPLLGERPGAGFHLGPVQRREHVPAGLHALVDLEGQAARDQRAGPVEKEVVGFRPIAAADDVNIARPARHQQRGLRPGPLDERVDRDRRAVDQQSNRVDIEPALADAIDDAPGEIVRRGQAFRVEVPAARRVEPDQVGERTADIDCQ